jgi:glucokinase
MGEQRSVGSADATGRIGISIADLGTQVEVIRTNDADGESFHAHSISFDRPPLPDELVARIDELVTSVAERYQSPLSGAGVAVWGRIDPMRGIITDARFGEEWVGVALAARLQLALGVPTWLTTGVRASARAEYLARADRHPSPLLYIHLSRTLSSALVVNGEPMIGAHYDEGRLEHWQTGREGPRCVCGVVGHLGPLASAQSLVRLAIGVAVSDDDALTAIQRVTGGRAEALTLKQLIGLANAGVAPLRELVEYALDALADALANLVVTFDPAIIVIGGALAYEDSVFFDWLRQRVAERLHGGSSLPEIMPALYGKRGAVYGAMMMEPR